MLALATFLAKKGFYRSRYKGTLVTDRLAFYRLMMKGTVPQKNENHRRVGFKMLQSLKSNGGTPVWFNGRMPAGQLGEGEEIHLIDTSDDLHSVRGFRSFVRCPAGNDGTSKLKPRKTLPLIGHH